MSDLPTIPHFELATQWQLIRNEVEAAVKEVLDSQQYTSGADSGPFIGRFETNLAQLTNAHVTALSSGTDAILAALMALGIKRGHEVITTPFTFFATAGCISRSGAKPVFADIDPNTFLLRLDTISNAVTRNTRAILPVHLFGQMMDTTALLEFADAHHVDVIEDAAQCVGALDPKGKQVAENARCACLSFYPTKNLGAAGDAGELAESIGYDTGRLAQARSPAAGRKRPSGLRIPLSPPRAACWRSRSPMPSWSRLRSALGHRLSAAPVAAGCSSRSRTATSMPRRCRATAAARPPIPPPAMTAFTCCSFRGGLPNVAAG